MLLRLVQELGAGATIHRLPPPPEEAHLHGKRHSRARDAAAVRHHYDVSNAFYRMVLGPTMTYSCAVFHDAADTLEQAQENKYELICRKLGLQPGMRLLDVGCGWGGMAMHGPPPRGQRGGRDHLAPPGRAGREAGGEAGLSGQWRSACRTTAR